MELLPLFLQRSPRITIRASSRGFDVARIVNEANGKGVVHSCFSRAVNVLFAKNEIVSIVDQSVGNGPFNVVVNCTQGFDTFNINCGDRVSARVDSFLIGDGLEINTSRSKPYVSQHDFTPRLVEISDIRKNIVGMKHIVENFGKFEGLHSILHSNFHESSLFLTSSASGVLDKISLLISSMVNNDFENVRAHSQALLGLGLGLTPSADDLLCGLMLAYYVFTENLNGDLEKAQEVNRAILHHSTQTTTLSQNYLRQAASGNGTELTQNVIEDLLTTKIGSNNVERTTIELLRLGSSSGTDTAIGIMLGSILAIKKMGGLGKAS